MDAVATVTRSEPRPGFRQGLALVGLSAGALLASRLLAGADLEVSLCGFKALVGLPCPFCGGIRASAALVGGAFSEALRWNPAAALGHGAFLATGLLLLLGKTPPWLRAENQQGVLRQLAVILIANWIYLVAVGR